MKTISQKSLDFLLEIKQNNNREWFQANKERYLIIKKEIEDFSAHWFWELNWFDESLQEMGTKPYMFRIYRDARFAKGKKYKENYGILIVKWGKPWMHDTAGYFLNIEPGNCYLVWWAFRPAVEWLRDIRKNICEKPEEINDILENNDFKKNFNLKWEQLKTAPRWFAKDHPQLELLRYKDLYAFHSFSDAEVLDKNFLIKLSKLSKILSKFDGFLNKK